jgi:hypothetical protein
MALAATLLRGAGDSTIEMRANDDSAALRRAIYAGVLRFALPILHALPRAIAITTVRC